MNYQELAMELKKHFPAAAVCLSGGGAGAEFIEVVFPDEHYGRIYTVGDANPTWGGAFYASVEDYERGEESGTLDSHLPVAQTEPWLVGLNLAAAISRYEAEG